MLPKLVASLFVALILQMQFATELFAQQTNVRIIQSEAYAAEPFGVGKITFAPGSISDSIHMANAILIDDEEGRVLYPAFSQGVVARVLGNQNSAPPVRVVWFLFRGDTPLSVSINAASSAQVELKPIKTRPRLARMTMQQWWRNYNTQARVQRNQGDYPPVVEAYLTTMLESRLGLQPPLIDRLNETTQSQLQQTVALMFNTETQRADNIRTILQETPRSKVRSLALPAPVDWDQTPPIAIAGEVPVEPIAMHVPRSCFYLRFGTWDNQLWLKRLMAEYGGDLGRMIQLRGHQTSNPDKMLEQLAIETSNIDDMFGGNLIQDVAVVGHDFYIDDGPAIGVMFHAKSGLLQGNFDGKRKGFARKNKETVTLETVGIAGRDVSFLSSDDGKVRSYYAVDGDFHLVSTSREIIREFFECGQDGSISLGSQHDFRYARTVLPVERDDTVFAYLSSEFFQNLLSPKYQVAVNRRNRLVAREQVLQLAMLAAENEGHSNPSIEELIQNQFLPDGFEAVVTDFSGERGYFTPIPDMEIDSVTAWESAMLTERIQFFSRELKKLDPIFVGVKRFELDDNVERLVIDGRIAPFGAEKYSWLGQMLGEPLQHEISAGADDLISFQASMAGSSFIGNIPPHQLFAAVQHDAPPKTDLQPTNLLEVIQLLKTTPGYLGAWPAPGYLDLLPALGGQPDENGFTYSQLLDIWRLQEGEFSAVSFDRQRLEQLRGNLRPVPAEVPAQVRLRVGDIANSNLQGWTNALFYQRSLQASFANIKLANTMIQQFGVPIEDAIPIAETLLGVKFVCPLGGEYQLVQSTNLDHQLWQSSAWHRAGADEPYLAPPMVWFKGLSLDVYQLQTQFVVHGSVDIKRKDGGGGGGLELPSINLFKGFSKVEEIEPKEDDGASRGELNPPKDDDGR